MSKHDLNPGDVLDLRFEIERVLNRGGMASIFTAKDRETGASVAVKVPHLQYESDPAFFARFQREAEVGLRLNHPNILRFYHPMEQSRLYIVTELLQGRTLGEMLGEARVLPISASLKIAVQISEALAHMHAKGIVHRDLKPQNIMLCTDGSLRIMDFGIAKAAAMTRLTFVGFTNPMGTPDYMAPEQVKGQRGDERTDIYSLGAILYEMLTGAPPFEAPGNFLLMNIRLVRDPVALRKKRPEVSAEIEEIVHHAMERDPKRRYATALQMRNELMEPSTVTVTGRAERLVAAPLWKARWRAVRLIVFCVAGTLIVFLLALLISRLHGR